jgi:hypothetical protein
MLNRKLLNWVSFCLNSINKVILRYGVEREAGVSVTIEVVPFGSAGEHVQADCNIDEVEYVLKSHRCVITLLN